MSILNVYTKDKHREVEQCNLIQYLFSEDIQPEVYVPYLCNLEFIYRILEVYGMSTGAFDGMFGLLRAERIAQDLFELDPKEKYERGPTCYSVIQYVGYIRELYHTNPELIMAHIYVRHMGDLYGGKMLARRVPGSGKAYEFENRKELIKTFNERLSFELADEANHAFDWFIRIFDDIWENLDHGKDKS